MCPASVCGVNVTERDSVSVDSVGTVRVRVGFAFDRYLPYVTAGYAYGHATGQATFSALLPPVTQGINATGWVAGAGFDVGGSAFLFLGWILIVSCYCACWFEH